MTRHAARHSGHSGPFRVLLLTCRAPKSPLSGGEGGGVCYAGSPAAPNPGTLASWLPRRLPWPRTVHIRIAATAPTQRIDILKHDGMNLAPYSVSPTTCRHDLFPPASLAIAVCQSPPPPGGAGCQVRRPSAGSSGKAGQKRLARRLCTGLCSQVPPPLGRWIL